MVHVNGPPECKRQWVGGMQVWEREGSLPDTLAGTAVLPFSAFFRSPTGDRGPGPPCLSSRQLPNLATPPGLPQSSPSSPKFTSVTLNLALPDQALAYGLPCASGRLYLGLRYTCVEPAEEGSAPALGEGTDGHAGADPLGDHGMSLVPLAPDAHAPVQATVSVEVYRACGLQAAVEEAALSGSTGGDPSVGSSSPMWSAVLPAVQFLLFGKYRWVVCGWLFLTTVVSRFLHHLTEHLTQEIGRQSFYQEMPDRHFSLNLRGPLKDHHRNTADHLG